MARAVHGETMNFFSKKAKKESTRLFYAANLHGSESHPNKTNQDNVGHATSVTY